MLNSNHHLGAHLFAVGRKSEEVKIHRALTSSRVSSKSVSCLWAGFESKKAGLFVVASRRPGPGLAFDRPTKAMTSQEAKGHLVP